MAIAGNPINNLDSNNVPYDILYRQPPSTLNTNDIQKQTIPPQKDSYQIDSTKHIRIIQSQTWKKKQIIMNIDASSHSPNYVITFSRN